MNRRKFLILLGSTGAGGCALLAAEAAGRVGSRGRVRLAVTTDGDAALGLEPLDTPNGRNYVGRDGNGTLTIDVHRRDESSGSAGAVGSGRFTFFDRLFALCNRSPADVAVSYELRQAPTGDTGGDDGAAVSGPENRAVGFYYRSAGGDDPGRPGDRIFLREERALPIAPGECREIGVCTAGIDATDEGVLIDGTATIVGRHVSTSRRDT